MKMNLLLPLAIAFSISASAVAQSNQARRADPTAMHGMDMKNMDMDDCMHMKGMGSMDMKKMDAKKCEEMMSKMKAAKSPASAGMHAADGVVKDVDAAGKVVLQHEQVKSLGWPAMTMAFEVKDKTLLDKLAVGRKVHVEFNKQGGEYVINSVN